MSSKIILSGLNGRKLLWRRFASHAAIVPPSVHKILTQSDWADHGNIAVRDVGCTRRVFLLQNHLTCEQIEGLAYRIEVMTKNASLNSVLVANDDTTDSMPSSATELNLFESGSEPESSLSHVGVEGYDPVDLFKSGTHRDTGELRRLLDGITALALATRGNAQTTRIPVVTLPRGHVNDGGYALCMGGYVLANPKTTFSIANPSRGLTFDPVGFSFMLPRLGWEFQQPCADYIGCGMILALTGMKANASDMMETGLATHYLDSCTLTGAIERGLADLPPWNQQKLLRNPTRFYGQPERTDDVNASFRNVAVANLVNSFSTYSASGVDMFSTRDTTFLQEEDDPSINLENRALYGNRDSSLVNYAATFDSIFKEEQTAIGIFERFRDTAALDALDEETRSSIAVAKDLLNRMQKQSPLAISVIFALMQQGAKKGESLESCMKREKEALLKMFTFPDFEKWANHSASGRGNFIDWQYKRLADVPQDHVDDIIGS